jgi:hypothetical protein
MKNYLIISAVVLALVMAGPAQILAQTTIGATVPVARATFFSQLESFINNVVKFVYDLQTKSVVVVSTGGSNTPAPSAPSTPLVAMVGAVDTGDRVTDHPLAPITMYCKGDMNHDGVVNNFDIDGFTATLQANNSGDYWSNFPQTWYADVAGGKDGEGDQVLNDTDNDTFLDMVLNHPVLHCVPELPEAPKPPIAGEPARFCKGDMNHDGRVMNKLRDKNVKPAHVTLHVGLGTFSPVTEQNISQRKLHEEYFDISGADADAIASYKKEGKPIVAVGTTTVRTLEAVGKKLLDSPASVNDKTDLFIYPPYDFQIIDGLITNFHLPQSSLMCLVEAFLQNKKSQKKLLELYEIAIQNRFRFYSFGDAMLII